MDRSGFDVLTRLTRTSLVSYMCVSKPFSISFFNDCLTNEAMNDRALYRPYKKKKKKNRQTESALDVSSPYKRNNRQPGYL